MGSLNLDTALNALLKFRNDRDWSKFHTPKNLAVSLHRSGRTYGTFSMETDEESNEYLSSPKFEDVKTKLPILHHTCCS